MDQIIIGTRASKLALWQAHHVKDLIESQLKIPVQIKKISTKGDQIQDRSLMEIGGKGLFLKEIEEELLADQIDIAVHSMKDVPYDLTAGLEIVAILARADSSDAFVCNQFNQIQDLPDKAVVGTSSLRRMLQLQKQYPHLKFKDLRGNVDTRLKKLDNGEFDAIILASAGLIRLGWESRIAQRLDIVSAVGQGAVGIEINSKRQEIKGLMKRLNHVHTEKIVTLERVFSKLIEGTCQTPMGCHVVANETDDHFFKLICFRANPDGSDYNEHELTGKWDDGERLLKELIG
ncbi:hydroxymethylbilane synthase [bacterium K02(2017)]|nr:hydroxymethylbilane synthase [bacterium K02(2017)]